MSQPTCSTPGCGKPRRCKGMCSTHYNQANTRPIEVECEACGTTVIRSNEWARSRYRVSCSTACRAYLQHGPASCAVPGMHPSRSTRIPEDHPSRISLTCVVPSDHPSRYRVQRAAFVAGQCAECAGSYVIASEWVTHSRYCSTTCARRYAKRARRAREAGTTGSFTWDDFTKLALSLGNVCAYCRQGNPDGRALEPDHVRPISRGGHNGLTNILPACRSCNGRKSDLTLAQWQHKMRLYGHPPLDLARFKHLTAHIWGVESHAA